MNKELMDANSIIENPIEEISFWYEWLVLLNNELSTNKRRGEESETMEINGTLSRYRYNHDISMKQ